MTLRNRVTPHGTIEALPGRGLLTGNRGGRLHDDEGNLVRGHASRSWISCLLEFKDRRKPVMAPGMYSSLFFLDEATAMAAGHRPCFECRRPAARAFLEAWCRTHPGSTASDVDRILHRQRLSGRWPRPAQVTYREELTRLPTGAFVVIGDGDGDGDGDGRAWLVLDDHLRRWGHDGYHEREERPSGRQVTVLTPRSMVAAMANGYAPSIHPSASGR